MTQNDFIICAPFAMVNISHGVRTLIELARNIQKSGRRAFLCTYVFLNGQETVFPVNLETHVPGSDAERLLVDALRQIEVDYGVPFLTDFSSQFIDTCYVVYPETMTTQNALNAKRVIRYFLNKDGALTGRKVVLGHDDFILAYSQVMHPHPHHICFYAGHDVSMFNSDNTLATAQRKLDLTYIGKGATFGVTSIVRDSAEITRTWPATKEQLAILLRNCRFFYTADACSKINLEALSCGAVPVYMFNGPWTDEEIDGSEFGAIPRIYLDTKVGPDFFAEFDVRRAEFENRVKAHMQVWDESVQQMIAKVDQHFAQRLPARFIFAPNATA